MGSIAIAQANKINADKAQALDNMQSDDALYQAREAGGMETRLAVEDAIRQKQQYQQMDQNLARGSAFAQQPAPQGPSMWDEFKSYMSGKGDNIVTNFNALTRSSPWQGTEAEQNMLRQGAAEKLRQDQYHSQAPARNLSPANRREAIAEYERSLGE